MAALPLIPATVVGSHGKPGWWFATVKAYEAGEHGPADLEEMFDDAADTAIRDMERAGLDIITDGEVRRLDGYVDSYYAIIKGIEPLPVRRKAGPWGYDQQTRYEATGRIETPPGGLGIVKEFEYLRAHTTKGVKATCAGPLTFGSRIHPGKLYKGVVDVAERFAEVINAELRGLVAAGADFIQLDEPARGERDGRGDGAALQPRHRGRARQARFSRLLRQPLRPLPLRPHLSPVLPRPARRARGSVRARVRGTRALGGRRVEGVRGGPRARRRRRGRQGLLPRGGGGRGPAHPARARGVPRRRSSTSIPTAASGGPRATCATRRSAPSRRAPPSSAPS